MYYVYMLFSKQHDRFYIGQTKDLKRRLKQHNDGEVKSTRPYRPWLMVHTEAFPTRTEAMKREHFLKKQRNKGFYRRLANDFLKTGCRFPRGLGVPPERETR